MCICELIQVRTGFFEFLIHTGRYVLHQSQHLFQKMSKDLFYVDIKLFFKGMLNAASKTSVSFSMTKYEKQRYLCPRCDFDNVDHSRTSLRSPFGDETPGFEEIE